METADVVIIGGGVIGTSIAYRLAGNHKVILIEKGEIGAGTSGSCDKAIFLQSKKPGFPIKLAQASRMVYENLEEELGMKIEFQKNGGMIVIENESHLDFMRKFVKQQNKAGINVKLVDQKEALAFQPCLSPEIVGATYSTEDAEVNPLLLTQAFAEAAKRKGIIIRTHTAVTDIVTKDGRVIGVQTNKGRIETELVINAAGPFAPKIAEMVGVGLPIIPRRGVILISEKVKPMVHGNILCSQYIATKHLSNNTDAPSYGIGLSLGQTESGNVLIGGSREFKGYDKAVEPEVLTAIAMHARRIAPFLDSIRIIRTMAGFRPFTSDGLPIISETPNMKGFIIAAGHEGDGIALAPITGLLVASLVNKDLKYKDFLDPLKFDRFNAIHASPKQG
ncbi:NAD(P)/FAD-dependent oxidoreductase [Oceanobacillus polygoni]|uniref:Sarcosine oxidase subunit beta n=1 Tax=Oceanobacillus polygoni TaxID=1235259 RepID=A0A9X0YZ29_9BACI|nr:FAD-dependent oxidoreductase [Oceanobacillus polygoni]MBP2079259.1 sarcosine oxidase subunit beta [Oceanobacillus polygoni]